MNPISVGLRRVPPAAQEGLSKATESHYTDA